MESLLETLMHVSSYVLNEEVEREIKPFRKPTYYIVPAECQEKAEAED